MPNVGTLISVFNKKKTRDNPRITSSSCNCRNKKICPHQGKCQQECVVYQAKIYKDIDDCNKDINPKVYIGATRDIFKKRYYNHTSSFNIEKTKHSTTLSSYVWKIRQENNKDPILKWEI